MSNCDITSGFSLGCRDNIGGLKAVYIMSGSIDSVSEASEGLINSISGSGAFFKFELPRNVGDWTETITPSQENGTIFYDQAINATFHKLQSATRNQIKALGQNPALKVVIELENGSADGVGKFWLAGQNNGMSVSAGSGASGAAFGDLNGYTITLSGQEPFPASEISGSLTSILSGITVS